MFNIALLGAGRIGQVHAANIASHGATTLWSVVDPNQEFATRLAAQYQARQQSLNEAMTDPNVHAVLIASATDTHADLIEMAARHGKAIFCEKPVHLDLARVRDCLKVVKEYDVPLFIGFNRRFDPQFRRVKTEAQAGRIGKPESLLIISRDPSPPPAEYVRVSGGMFRDMTIHDFDMARFIMGEEPVSVYAQGSNLVDPAIGEAGDIDTAFIVLKYASGAMATIVNSRRSSYGYDQRLELHGSEGLLCAGNILENQVQHYGKQGCTSALPEHFFPAALQIRFTPRNGNTLLRSCAGEAVPDCSGDDGERALYLADKRWSHCAASARSSSKHNNPTQRDIIMKKLIVAALIAMTSGAALAENEQIVFSTPNLAMPFEVHMQRTAVKAAKEMGVKLQVLDGQGSSPKQVADLENAITRGAQGFIVSPNDVNAVSSAVDEIQDAKLPIVTLDRSVDSQKKVPHFGANNYKGGQAVGDFG
ncbi:oxidoreductase domain-containing protein [Enterobacter asburiae]|uniref:Oxidoreductase domain-containing protein n=4 Tax=Enterobacteriaceae TaxID=543 RepID=A0A376FL86_ENTAS|nr:oxidoreductase domain-containing protein [Enterobacter asburiae]